MLFNFIYVRQLPLQVHHCHLVSYCDDLTLLKVVPSKEARKLAARRLSLIWMLFFVGGKGGTLNLSEGFMYITEMRSRGKLLMEFLTAATCTVPPVW